MGEVETVTFLLIIKESRIVQLLDTNTKHSIVFGNVSIELKNKGFTRSIDQLKQRYDMACTCANK